MQVFAIAAQHADLAPVESRAEDQLVEAVVLGVAAPDALERCLERTAYLLDVEHAVLRRLDRDVLDIQRTACDLEFVQVFGQYLDTEIFKQRNDFGQRRYRRRVETP